MAAAAAAAPARPWRRRSPRRAPPPTSRPPRARNRTAPAPVLQASGPGRDAPTLPARSRGGVGASSSRRRGFVDSYHGLRRPQQLEPDEADVDVRLRDRHDENPAGRIAGHHEERALFRLKMPEDARSRASRFHSPAQPAGEARRQRGHGAALDAFHQLLGDDEPVLGRDEHRATDAAHARDEIERLAHCFSSQRRAISVARCARIASRPSGMPRSRTTRSSASGVGCARWTLPFCPSADRPIHAPRPSSLAVRAASCDTPARYAATASVTSVPALSFNAPPRTRPAPSMSSNPSLAPSSPANTRASSSAAGAADGETAAEGGEGAALGSGAGGAAPFRIIAIA